MIIWMRAGLAKSVPHGTFVWSSVKRLDDFPTGSYKHLDEAYHSSREHPKSLPYYLIAHIQQHFPVNCYSLNSIIRSQFMMVNYIKYKKRLKVQDVPQQAEKH